MARPKKTAHQERVAEFAQTVNGAEPKFVLGEVNDSNHTIKLLRALNWYALESDGDISKNWYLAKTENSSRFKKIPAWEFGNVGFLLRLIERGFPETEYILDKIKFKTNQLEHVLALYEEPKEVVKKVKVPAVDTMLLDVYESIDLFVDGFVNNKRPTLKIDITVLSKSQQNNVKTYLNKQLAEYESAYRVKDVDNNNAYNLTASQCKSMSTKFREVLNVLNVNATTKRVTKPKVAKVKPIAKILEKIKYTAAYNEYKGLTLEKVLHSQKVLAYNTKSRKAIVYYSTDSLGFNFKGTSLTNVDEVKSTSKTLRKPEEQLKILESASKTQLERLLDRISSMESKPTLRVTPEVIFLKAWS